MTTCFLILSLVIFFCFGSDQYLDTVLENKSKISITEKDSEFEINEEPSDEFEKIISESQKDLSQSARVFFNSNFKVIEEIPLFQSEQIIQNSDHNVEINKESINLGSNKQEENRQNFINSVITDDKVLKKSSYDKFTDWIRQFCCNNNTQVTNLEEILYQQ